jgi:hypothetical protein
MKISSEGRQKMERAYIFFLVNPPSLPGAGMARAATFLCLTLNRLARHALSRDPSCLKPRSGHDMTLRSSDGGGVFMF